MRALVMTRYGRNDVVELREHAEPVPGPHDVLIDVHAAALNPIDYKIRLGQLRLIRKLRFPAVLGNELAGVVVALIPSVLLFAFAQRYFIEGITTGSFR